MAAVDAVGSRDGERSRLNRISYIVIGTAQRIHSRLGFGFNEKVYENALCLDLGSKGLDVRQQCGITVLYDGIPIGDYVPDLVVEDSVIVEIKAVERMETVHRRQCLNYLRATGFTLGLVLNFNRSRLEVARLVNKF